MEDSGFCDTASKVRLRVRFPCNTASSWARRALPRADPLTALAIAAVAVKEGRESWKGKGCADGCC